MNRRKFFKAAVGVSVALPFQQEPELDPVRWLKRNGFKEAWGGFVKRWDHQGGHLSMLRFDRGYIQGDIRRPLWWATYHSSEKPSGPGTVLSKGIRLGHVTFKDMRDLHAVFVRLRERHEYRNDVGTVFEF